MSSFRQSIFLVATYLAAIFILAQFDYSDSPIIDFAKYFYFAVMVAVPATIFFPNITKVNVGIPIILWGSIYFVMLQMLDRSISAPDSNFAIILLEFVLLLLGVWIAYQLADGINHAESILEAMAISAFPNRVRDIHEASRQIKTEINRSRRYYRPLSLIILSVEFSRETSPGSIILNIQHDLTNRFSLARMSQIIDEHVRQTDMVFRDQQSRFILLCPETNSESSFLLAGRITATVKELTGVDLLSGIAVFPDDAINFDDLIDAASRRLTVYKHDSGKIESPAPS
jgi:GGDEF domain-containing protein